ncbi:MAG: DegQ family serine endoprotease [Alphaproteobacteria bacterium]|nr:DegQ family serine endoprotease [Alphaproteobacteria bacterium]
MSDQTNSPTKTRRRASALVAALMATSILGGALAWQVTPAFSQGQPPLNAPHSGAPVASTAMPGFADLVARVKPAVVHIAVTMNADARGARAQELPQNLPEFFRRFFDENGRGMPNGRGPVERGAPAQALGSGFIIDASGYVVTNNHVVENADRITVTLEDGSAFRATVRGRDPQTDLALLKIDAGRPLPYVAFGDSAQARVGEWVVAVGSPFGLGNSVTAGIVSALGRDIHAGPYDDFIQVDAPINRGNSGGPLFDQAGNVIGVNTAIYSPNGGSVGIGFAIPAATASRVVAQLRDTGRVERGWLGVAMQPLTEDLSKAMRRGGATDGIVVSDVQPDSPAARAGLQQGDVVTAVNGAPVRAPRDLARAVADTRPGQALRLTVSRDGQERQLAATIAANPAGQQVADARGAVPAEGRVGLALAPLSPQARQQLGVESGVNGVVVARVAPNSRAAESGLKAGDVILRIGNEAVATPDAAVARIRAAEHDKREAVPVLVMREGTTYYLALRLAQA